MQHVQMLQAAVKKTAVMYVPSLSTIKLKIGALPPHSGFVFQVLCYLMVDRRAPLQHRQSDTQQYDLQQ